VTKTSVSSLVGLEQPGLLPPPPCADTPESSEGDTGASATGVEGSLVEPVPPLDPLVNPSTKAGGAVPKSQTQSGGFVGKAATGGEGDTGAFTTPKSQTQAAIGGAVSATIGAGVSGS
jgi:hypothetical protein